MFLIGSWSLFQDQSHLPLSIINYGISKHYAGSQVSDRCPLGYLFLVTWHLGQDDKIMLILYTNLYIFKVTFNQES